MIKFEDQIEEKLKELENISGSGDFQDKELEELMTTANAGPYSIPQVFLPQGKESKAVQNSEKLGFKKAPELRLNMAKESIFKQFSQELFEVSYPEYRDNTEHKPHQKVNLAIQKINRHMWEIEKTMRQNLKLKQEFGVSNGQFWKSTDLRLKKIAERMIKLANGYKQLMK